MFLASLIAAAALSGSWTGSYTLGGPGQLALAIQGARATVALGVGHAGVQSVPVAITGRRVAFRLSGVPAPLAFSGRLAGGRIRGTVRQASARGAFQVKRGTSPALVAPGFY